MRFMLNSMGKPIHIWKVPNRASTKAMAVKGRTSEVYDYPLCGPVVDHSVPDGIRVFPIERGRSLDGIADVIHRPHYCIECVAELCECLGLSPDVGDTLEEIDDVRNGSVSPAELLNKWRRRRHRRSIEPIAFMDGPSESEDRSARW